MHEVALDSTAVVVVFVVLSLHHDHCLLMLQVSRVGAHWKLVAGMHGLLSVQDWDKKLDCSLQAESVHKARCTWMAVHPSLVELIVQNCLTQMHVDVLHPLCRRRLLQQRDHYSRLLLSCVSESRMQGSHQQAVDSLTCFSLSRAIEPYGR